MGARWINPVLVAVACGAGLLWTAVAAFHMPRVVDLEVRVFDEFYALRRMWTISLAHKIARIGDPAPFAVISVILVGIAMVRRERRLAVAAAAILMGSNVTTQVLKPLTATDRHPFFLPDATWPSGHATAAAALGLCLVLVVPSRLRGMAAAIGAIASVAMAYSLLLLGSHRPSDILAGMLVAGMWAASAVAVLERAAARQPSRPANERLGRVRLLAPPVVAAAAVATVGLLSRSGTLLLFVSDKWLLAVGAALLAATAFAVVTATALIWDA